MGGRERERGRGEGGGCRKKGLGEEGARKEQREKWTKEGEDGGGWREEKEFYTSLHMWVVRKEEIHHYPT